MNDFLGVSVVHEKEHKNFQGLCSSWQQVNLKVCNWFHTQLTEKRLCWNLTFSSSALFKVIVVFYVCFLLYLGILLYIVINIYDFNIWWCSYCKSQVLMYNAGMDKNFWKILVTWILCLLLILLLFYEHISSVFLPFRKCVVQYHTWVLY